MADQTDAAGRSGKLIVLAALFLVILPSASLAGWLYWLASEDRPWMMGFGAVLVVFVMVSWPVEFLLSRNERLRRLTGGGRFHRTVVQSISLYLLLIIVVGLNDLDHDRSLQSNLKEYLLTIGLAAAFLFFLELSQPIIMRRWAAWRQRRTRKS